MDLNEYQTSALQTAFYPGIGLLEGLTYASLALGGEVGEFQNKVKKVLRGDKDFLALGDALRDELGDILWYVAAAARELGVSLDGIAKRNLEKLESRKERGVLQGDGDNR